MYLLKYKLDGVFSSASRKGPTESPILNVYKYISSYFSETVYHISSLHTITNKFVLLGSQFTNMAPVILLYV